MLTTYLLEHLLALHFNELSTGMCLMILSSLLFKEVNRLEIKEMPESDGF